MRFNPKSGFINHRKLLEYDSRGHRFSRLSKQRDAKIGLLFLSLWSWLPASSLQSLINARVAQRGFPRGVVGTHDISAVERQLSDP